MWMMPLHLHVNQKSDYDYDDDIDTNSMGLHIVSFKGSQIEVSEL